LPRYQEHRRRSGHRVRSRSLVGSLGASLQTLVGGNITLYTELCEKARDDAFRLMCEHAGELGANAVADDSAYRGCATAKEPGSLT